EEEQLRVAIRGHDRPPPAAELQHAGDPALADVPPPDFTLVVVQTAAVAHERAALRRRNQIAERRHPVLQWHRLPPPSVGNRHECVRFPQRPPTGEKTRRDPTPNPPLPDKDKLVTRPEAPLPPPLEPDSPAAHGYPADPKRVPATGQGDPDATNPAPD